MTVAENQPFQAFLDNKYGQSAQIPPFLEIRARTRSTFGAGDTQSLFILAPKIR